MWAIWCSATCSPSVLQALRSRAHCQGGAEVPLSDVRVLDNVLEGGHERGAPVHLLHGLLAHLELIVDDQLQRRPVQWDAVHILRLQLGHVLGADVVPVLDGHKWGDVVQDSSVRIPKSGEDEMVDHQHDLRPELLHVVWVVGLNPCLLDLDLPRLRHQQIASLRLIVLIARAEMPKRHSPELSLIQLLAQILEARLSRAFTIFELVVPLLELLPVELEVHRRNDLRRLLQGRLCVHLVLDCNPLPCRLPCQIERGQANRILRPHVHIHPQRVLGQVSQCLPVHGYGSHQGHGDLPAWSCPRPLPPASLGDQG